MKPSEKLGRKHESLFLERSDLSTTTINQISVHLLEDFFS